MEPPPIRLSARLLALLRIASSRLFAALDTPFKEDALFGLTGVGLRAGSCLFAFAAASAARLRLLV